MNRAIRITHPLIKIGYRALIDLPTPTYIRAWWNFESLLGACLVIQSTVLLKHWNHILQSSAYLLRCKLWMNPTSTPCQRSISLHHLHLHTHWTKYTHILQLIQTSARVINWSSNSRSLHRICIAMRTNIILRGISDYKPTFSIAMHRNSPSPMSMRWVYGRQRNTNTILLATFPNTVTYHSIINSTSVILAPNWMQ
jgi:hypothetical protein